jgi:hypothetical protein
MRPSDICHIPTDRGTEYATPKVSGGPPNLQGLDEKTAKLLLDERQVGPYDRVAHDLCIGLCCV